MRTQCNPESMLFARLDRRDLVADFGVVARSPRTPGRCCWARPTRRSSWSTGFAACFTDGRTAGRVVRRRPHAGRPAGVRHRPRLRGSERPRRSDVAIRCSGLFSAGWRRAGRGARRLAGKSTLKPAGARPGRRQPLPLRSAHDPEAIEQLFVRPVPGCPLPRRRRASRSIWTPRTIPITATRKAASSTASTTATATCRSTCSAASIYWRPSCAARTSMPARARPEEIARIVTRIRARWPRVRILLRADSGFAREALMAWCEAKQGRLPVSVWPATPGWWSRSTSSWPGPRTRRSAPATGPVSRLR